LSGIEIKIRENNNNRVRLREYTRVVRINKIFSLMSNKKKHLLFLGFVVCSNKFGRISRMHFSIKNSETE
jgi:hypothetical protein